MPEEKIGVLVVEQDPSVNVTIACIINEIDGFEVRKQVMSPEEAVELMTKPEWPDLGIRLVTTGSFPEIRNNGSVLVISAARTLKNPVMVLGISSLPEGFYDEEIQPDKIVDKLNMQTRLPRVLVDLKPRIRSQV